MPRGVGGNYLVMRIRNISLKKGGLLKYICVYRLNVGGSGVARLGIWPPLSLFL